ncbi:hypothetical protein ACCT30_50180, partial [Rhizobium ruizarguesonis]
WFFNLFEKQAVGDFGASFRRSFTLGLMVMAVTVIVSLLAGLAFRRRFRGSTALFYATVASLVVPSIIISLGIGVVCQARSDERRGGKEGSYCGVDLGG